MGTGSFLPVILGGDIGAYSLARTFHERYGVRAVVLSRLSGHMCGDSTILDNQVVCDIETPEGMLAALRTVAEKHPGTRLVLLACGDWYVRMIAENRDRIPQPYIVPYIDLALLDELVHKDRFYRLCQKQDVPIPRTVIYDCAHPHEEPAIPFGFPIAAKPASSADYHYVDFPGKRKVFFLHSPEELQALLRNLRQSGYRDKFLLQELIPGGDEQMRILTTYSDRRGKVRFAAFGQTLLEDRSAMGIGNPVAIINRRDNAIVEEARRLLESMGYRGFANFDIKVDPRSGRHCFFEINTRLGRSNYYLAAGGANAAEWIVRDLLEADAFPEEITIAPAKASEEKLYTVVPRKVLMKALSEPKLKREVRNLYRQNRVVNPLDYAAERCWKRRIYPAIFLLKQRRAFSRTASASGQSAALSAQTPPGGAGRRSAGESGRRAPAKPAMENMAEAPS